MLVLYVPFRLSWRRYVAEVRRALAVSPPDPLIDAYLARRAVENLSFDHVRALGGDPWRDIEEGRTRSLADREIDAAGAAASHERIGKARAGRLPAPARYCRGTPVIGPLTREYTAKKSRSSG